MDLEMGQSQGKGCLAMPRARAVEHDILFLLTGQELGG
jgi:hypothetical protein